MDEKTHALIERYEWRWVLIGITVLAFFMALMLYSVVVRPGIYSEATETGSPQKLLSGAMFSHPGVTRLGPHHYQAVVVARQFSFDPSTLRIPADSKVDFYLTSADVIHGFEVPTTDINIEVFPGIVSRANSQLKHPGRYVIACDQYCGIGHQNMIGHLIVEPANWSPPSGGEKSGSGATQTQPVGSAGAAAQAPAGPDGAQLYASHCSGCHQAQGQGMPGVFPPLTGKLPVLASSDGGRSYLEDILLFGMRGKVNIGGQSYNGNMPAWGGQLSDAQIAAVLNHVLHAWGNDKRLPKDARPYDASQVEAARKRALSPADVHAAFEKLGAH